MPLWKIDAKRKELPPSMVAGETDSPYRNRSGDPAEQQELDRLYAAAHGEGSLNLYLSGPWAWCRRSADRFAQRFPGIRVNLATGYSATLARAIDVQRRGAAPGPDLAVLQSVDDVERWASQGLLAPLRPPGSDQVMPAFIDPEGRYTGVEVNGLGYAYNPDLVAADEAPASAVDFLDQRFGGRVVSGFPHRDDLVLYLYHGLVERHGWRYVHQLLERRTAFVDGHGPLVQRVAAGDFAVTFDAALGLALSANRQGARIEIRVPDQEPMPVWAQTAAVFRDAPHPNTARLYLAWCLSEAEQRLVAENGSWPVRLDVPPPARLRPLSDYRLADGFGEFLRERALVAELRERLERYVGSP